VHKGDRIAIASRNLPEWVMAFWGSVVTGAVVVPLNAWWSTDELIYGLSDSGTTVLFVDEERLERVRPRLAELANLSTIVVWSDDANRPAQLGELRGRVRVVRFGDFLGEVDPLATPPEVVLEPDDDATILYTSGTTGHPKGAVGSHRNVLTNLMNLFFAAQRSALRFGAGDDATAPDVQSSGLLNIPFFHATGCHAFMIPATAAGNKIVMMHHFDAKRALKVIETERITGIGGAPAPPDLVKRLRSAFPGGQPGNGYGLTETSAGVCGNSGPDYVAKPNSCGPAYPVNEVAIVPEGFEGDEPSDELPRGPDVVGELWIKGPNVVRGYWNNSEATAEAFTKGWLHTGDIARIDDEGFVFIVDRAKDMI